MPLTTSASRPALAGPADAHVVDPRPATSGAPDARRLRFGVMAAAYLGLLGTALAVTAVRNRGTFTYAIDDPMSHLAIARNLGRAGTFGVAPGAYESASSAPLWNLLLAPVLAVVADAWWLPLLANAGAALWLLWTMSALPALAQLGRRRRSILVNAFLVVVLGRVPLTMTGMEHMMHAALLGVFLVVLTR